MHLHKLQQAFQNAVVNGDDKAILRQLTGKGRLSSKRRLNIYENNTAQTLVATLKAVYPVCNKLVGDEFFDAMAMLYVHEASSHTPNLNNYGASFAAFIKHFLPAQELPYLSDVAQLEWAVHRVFLGGAACVVESPYPILRIWQVNQDDHQGGQSVSLDEGGDKLMVSQHEQEIRVSALL